MYMLYYLEMVILPKIVKFTKIVIAFDKVKGSTFSLILPEMLRKDDRVNLISFFRKKLIFHIQIKHVAINDNLVLVLYSELLLIGHSFDYNKALKKEIPTSLPSLAPGCPRIYIYDKNNTLLTHVIGQQYDVERIFLPQRSNIFLLFNKKKKHTRLIDIKGNVLKTCDFTPEQMAVNSIWDNSINRHSNLLVGEKKNYFLIKSESATIEKLEFNEELGLMFLLETNGKVDGYLGATKKNEGNNFQIW